MTTLAGALNGGKVWLLAFTDTGQLLFIGGQTAHSKTLTTTPIDISNKATPDDRCFLEGEGLAIADIVGEFIWNTEAAYTFVRDKSDAKEFFDILILYKDDYSRADRFTVMATGVSEPTEMNSAATSSITFNSNDTFNLDQSYELAEDTLPEDATDTFGDLAYGVV